jgi:hypothetical protein
MKIRKQPERGLIMRLGMTAAILLACAQSSAAGMIAEDFYPPCSAGVAPCRVDDTEPSPAARRPSAAAPAPAPNSAMLPCPLSVPCIANDNDNYDDGVKASAPRAPRAAEKLPAPSRGLVMRVTSDDSAVGDQATPPANPKPTARASARQNAKQSAPQADVKAPAAIVRRAAEPAPSAASDSAGRVSVSLAGTGDLKQRASQLVGESGARLARVDANSFNADDAETYIQAVELERAARRALDGRDYLAAVDLSRKANDLAGTLSANRDRAP